MMRLLVANRGEIALRVVRAATDLGLQTVAIVSEDDVDALHAQLADRVVPLRGAGPSAYLDLHQVVDAAVTTGCDALHPGYGFLSESPVLAEACTDRGVVFVGPTPAQLRLLGDKARARELAERCGVPVLTGTGPVTLEAARTFATDLGMSVMLKAVAGGGGRGIRLVRSPDDLDAAWARCESEAQRSFGDGRLYVEAAMPHARHIEVQVLGDGTGRVTHLGERDCTIQRRHQKLIEIAPSPTLDERTSEALRSAATRMAAEIELANVSTFEFLVDADVHEPEYVFLEANPRLQVEHTVTEELFRVDLVAAQLRLADGAGLDDVLAGRVTEPRGFALQARLNSETLRADGAPVVRTGTVERLDLPAGWGVRVDTAAFAGLPVGAAFDSLLAKIVVRADDVHALLGRARRALAETRVDGVGTNLDLLRTLLDRPEVGTLAVTTGFVDDHLPELVVPDEPVVVEQDGEQSVVAPLGGMVVSVAVLPGDPVAAGQELAVVEAMKMEHVVVAPTSGAVARVHVAVGDQLDAGAPIVQLLPSADPATAALDALTADDGPRRDLADVVERKQALLDVHRPAAVEQRRAKGARTARENVADLVDPGTFTEYGGLVVAAQRARRSEEELRRRTPGDGVVTGFGTINGDRFAPEVSRTLVIAFDETVLAGTMGEMAREKLKRVLEVAEREVRPVVLLAEGGGGRAGDTDGRVSVTGWTLDVACYHQLSRLSALTPLVGIVNGRCFAANAGMLACCDVIIGTAEAHLGVGGPSMIEGGRLGTFTAEEIGPMSVQTANGVVDLLVVDEAEAVATARRYLSYFQGDLDDWSCPDQERTRTVVPENRLRSYDVRDVVGLLADDGSVLELRPTFAPGMVTALARVEGRTLGIVANNPLHLGGAIDSDGADKATRFMKLCDAFDLPLLMLCDTPGMMVGPESERTAAIRRMGRMFVTGANLQVPFFTIVLRKAYGIGAELMAGGWFRAPRFTVAWPTGELGGMNIEGNVRLAYRAELDAIADPAERRAYFDKRVAEMHETGKALSVASHFEVDDVIDPADSRSWIAGAMSTHRPQRPRTGKKLPFVDPW